MHFGHVRSSQLFEVNFFDIFLKFSEEFKFTKLIFQKSSQISCLLIFEIVKFKFFKKATKFT